MDYGHVLNHPRSLVGKIKEKRFVRDGESHNESRYNLCPNPTHPLKVGVGPGLPGYLCTVLKAMVHGILHRVLVTWNT
jgi:hypothetical protein